MRHAHPIERPYVRRLLTSAFRQNPWITFLADPERRQAAFKRIIDFSIGYAYRRGGVLLSPDAKAAALCFRQNPSDRESWIDHLARLRLAVTSMPPTKLWTAIRHQRYLREQLPQEESFLRCWFLGASSDAPANRSTHQLVRSLFDWSDSAQLPLLAETTLAQNRRVYERYGFEVYHHWQRNDLGLEGWMMRRD